MSADVLTPDRYINRELSWIAFNERVLAHAIDPRTPLLDQAKFSSIFSNNLDEFFMVRVASLKSQVEAGITKPSEDGKTPLEQLLNIREKLMPLLQRQQEHFRLHLKQQLQQHQVHLLDYNQLNDRQRQWVDDTFQTSVFPVLTPLAVDPAHPFPFVSNLSINVAAVIRDPETDQRQFARVKVPQKNLPRFMAIPTELSDQDPAPIHTAIPLEQMIAFNLSLLFPGMTVEGHYFFRVTRDADLELRDLEADDLMLALEKGLRKRRMGGEVVRLEVPNDMPEEVAAMLQKGLAVIEEDLYKIDGPLGLDDLFGLSALPLPNLKGKTHSGQTPDLLTRSQQHLLDEGTVQPEDFDDIFAVMRRQDLLLHHPYDLFSTTVEEFINQAADDPQVMGIKMTLYRTSKDSPIIEALIRAAENGKQVMALVELKARFDEDNNIQWARQLERAGVHVVYGVLGLKTHTKIVLVVRREQDTVRSYVHIGTGNYNSKTSKLYTDLGLLSSHPELGKDLVELFNYLTGFSKQQSFRKLLVAPVTLRKGMMGLIRREIEHAQEGRPGSIRAKMNSLVDPEIITLLYEASQAGIQIELIIRGMCSLIPGKKGLSENIRVISIIGQFLEHSRIFWFSNGGTPEAYIGSADWMSRNLDRRVEAVTPIEAPDLQDKLQRLLTLYLNDNRGAWEMNSDGSFTQRRPSNGETERNSQIELIDAWNRGLPPT